MVKYSKKEYSDGAVQYSKGDLTYWAVLNIRVEYSDGAVQ